jgi:putative membrane-bound dehydrogenase-like protein
MRRTLLGFVLILALVALFAGRSEMPAQKAQQPPHGQDKMPGPALSPQEAIKKMQVPEGFTVELVASEPDIVNPVAMTFDEKGRIWITESVEYPRSSAGPGKDRIKILEDTKGSGKIDKVTVFAEGLNIPSGIAVGHGGVWVANAPDILFYKIGSDGKAAGKPEVVVTGFGRTDTHELPNSLTWGPDGWLYGLNGVFNHSHVKHQGKEYDFTCALFRIHPKTRAFELFCEGTSNPWGIALDTEGSAFVSACVIDHLWHLTESGYYHRQGGPYPPFTWKLGSIVKHRHQKAAYCGLHFFDSDAYPAEYREKLYMGNIHGGCINCDELTRDGSTYLAKPRPDFLTANDAWFMPVSQKTGPDGCLYVLDWYDRYHCYQDARRDPDGIDRLNGRLYRVRYKDAPRAPKFDLAKETDDQLIQRLHSPNIYFRDIAQRLLCERNTPEVRGKLRALILDNKALRKARMHALWALIGTGEIPQDLLVVLMEHPDPTFRAWGVRAAGNLGKVDLQVAASILAAAHQDPSPDVMLQVVIAARKLQGNAPFSAWLDVLARCGDDKLIPVIIWQNLHPLLEDQADAFLTQFRLRGIDLASAPGAAALLPRIVERILGSRKPDLGAVVALMERLLSGKDGSHEPARQCLALLAGKVQTGELGDRLPALRERLLPLLKKAMTAGTDGPLYRDAVLLAASLGDSLALGAARELATAPKLSDADRLRAVEALIAGRDDTLDKIMPGLFDPKARSAPFRGQLLTALSRLDGDWIGHTVLSEYPRLEPDLQPRAIEMLTQRPAWGKLLLAAVGEKKIPSSALNVNQVRKLLAFKDESIVKQVRSTWGTLREDRNPAREKVVADMRDFLKKTKGDPMKGVQVFKNVCAQCHKIHGDGQEVGPDLTGNGRSTFDQLLSNVFDPSLVIGASYQATTVETTKGRFLTGLLVEDSPQRVVLKIQGGKQEVIPRSEIDTVRISKVSLMPEDIEKQLKPQEIADLFAFLVLDRPPTDPTARKIPGAP